MTAQRMESVDESTRQLPPSMVERMSLILDAFDSPTTRLTLGQVARATHLPRSTTHRILDQLVKLDWLAQTPFGYSLGRRALGLGGGDRLDNELRAAAAPHLHDLVLRSGMVGHLATLDEAETCYLDKIGGRFAGAVPSRVGGRAPAHCTALGKSMLAWLEPEEVDRLLTDDLDRFTGRTIGDLGALHQELHRIRMRSGLAYESGESFPEIACVAAAVRGPEGPLGAISLVGDLTAPIERIAPLVLNAARAVSEELFPGMATHGRSTPTRARVSIPDPWAGRTTGQLRSVQALRG